MKMTKSDQLDWSRLYRINVPFYGKSEGWQWCWWHRYVGDIVMLMTLWWWLISDVGGRIIMLATFFVMSVTFFVMSVFSQRIKSVTNILNRSLTSKTCHQHICSPTSVTNIVVTIRSTRFFVKRMNEIIISIMKMPSRISRGCVKIRN